MMKIKSDENRKFFWCKVAALVVTIKLTLLVYFYEATDPSDRKLCDTER